jgi:hypothetical protein
MNNTNFEQMNIEEGAEPQNFKNVTKIWKLLQHFRYFYEMDHPKLFFPPFFFFYFCSPSPKNSSSAPA